MDQYCQEAVNPTEVKMDKGKVYPYVERSFQKLLSKGSPKGVEKWHGEQQRDLLNHKYRSQVKRKEWLR